MLGHGGARWLSIQENKGTTGLSMPRIGRWAIAPQPYGEMTVFGVPRLVIVLSPNAVPKHSNWHLPPTEAGTASSTSTVTNIGCKLIHMQSQRRPGISRACRVARARGSKSP
jgi:hypothetical protein